MADLYKYGVGVHLYKPIIKRAVVDFAVSADWTPAAGDVKISKDGGAAANVTNLPTAITMGNTAMWDFNITATEMQAAKIRISVSDSATKAVEDTFFEIDTYGNASAEHAVDLDDAVRAGLTALPNANAEAAGGLYTRGTGAGQINQPANGMIDGNVVRWNGTAVATPKTAGVPVVDWVPTGWRSATAQAGAAGSITLDASASATTDFYKYTLIMIISGTGAGQARICTAYNGSTKVATITPNWVTNPDATSVFAVVPLAISDLESWRGTALPAEDTAGYPKVTIKDGTGVGEIDTNAGAVVAVTTVTNLTNAPTSGDLTATMKASVNAEVVDALNVDTYAEPGQGTPAATLSLVAKINYLFKAWRNKKTQTSTTLSLFNDDAATVDQKATVSDDGTTTTIGEIATGP